LVPQLLRARSRYVLSLLTDGPSSALASAWSQSGSTKLYTFCALARHCRDWHRLRGFLRPLSGKKTVAE